MNLPEQVRTKLNALPRKPGVYLMRDRHGKVIYVGKAKSLRKRVGSYFSRGLSTRTMAMVTAADTVDWIVTETEVEAIMLEYELIQKHQPRFNIRLRDDKSFPFLAITRSEEWPRATVMRGKLKSGTQYFGPYAHAYAIRQTLDLLLTTIITPWQILWGKLLSGLRVSSVLSSFLLWPVFLALIMVSDYWYNLPTVAAYVVIFVLTCLTTAVLALFCSTVFRKTSTSLMATYVVILLLYLVPLAASFFGNTYFPNTRGTQIVNVTTVASPFAAAFNVPIYMDDNEDGRKRWERVVALNDTSSWATPYGTCDISSDT